MNIINELIYIRANGSKRFYDAFYSLRPSFISTEGQIKTLSMQYVLNEFVRFSWKYSTIGQFVYKSCISVCA